MTDSYATAKAAYRELRSTIGPWAKANDYRRWPGTQAGWQKPVGAEQHLFFKLEGYSMANPDTGNSCDGLVQLEPSGARGSAILRQSPFSCCLVQAELDELARIQGGINRPRYREGHMISFGYHSLQDARELAAFIARVLPQALDRFLHGRVARPVDDTPPHLRPKWLTTLGDPTGGG